MEQIYLKFLKLVEAEDKQGAVQYILNLLNNNEISVVDLYKKVLEPAMYNIDCQLDDREMCVWMEHVRSSIVRTIIECSYPYVIKERKEINGLKDQKVLVFCPPEEQHEIGALMVSNFFILNGFDSIFIGANTPREDFVKAIKYFKPKYIAISISNFYNLFNTKKVIEYIRSNIDYDLKIIVGGLVFNNNQNAILELGADLLINNYEDIVALGMEVSNEFII